MAHGTQFSRRKCYHVRCGDVFVGDDMKEREKLFDVSTGKQKLLLDLPGISEVQSDVKKNLRGITLGITAVWGIIRQSYSLCSLALCG